MGLSPMTRAIFERLGFYPYPEQRDYLAHPARNKLLAGGIQVGKSTLVMADHLMDWPAAWEEARLNGSAYWWLVGQAYRDAAKEYEYIEAAFDTLGMVVKSRPPKNHAGELILKGNIQLHTFSGAKPETISGEAPRMITVSEAARTSAKVYETVQERSGPGKAKLRLAGTFERDLQSWYNALYWHWLSGSEFDSMAFSLPSWINLSRFPGGRNDPEILRLEDLLPEDVFRERYGGEPVKPRGLVFPEFTPQYHVKTLDYHPEWPLYLFDDPGYGSDHESSHALLAVQREPATRIRFGSFDEIYRSGRITERIIDEAMGRPWWNHPSNVILVVDPSYKDVHHSMPSVAEEWRKQTGLVARGEKVSILQGIERLRVALKIDVTLPPRLLIDPRCRGLLSELGVGRSPTLHKMAVYSYDVNPDGTSPRKPDDKYNHSIKALIYGIVKCFGYVDRPAARQGSKIKRWTGHGYE